MSGMISEATQAIKRASVLLGRATVFRLATLIAIRVLVGLLDVIGVVFLAAFSTSALSDDPSNQANIPSLLEKFLIVDFDYRAQLAIAITCLTFKSIGSYLVTVWSTQVLNSRCQILLQRETQNLSQAQKQELDKFSTQELHFLLTSAMRASTVGIMSPFATIVAESSMLLMLLGVLFLTNPLSTLLSILILGSTSVSLYRIIAERQYEAGRQVGRAAVTSMSLLQESIHGYREYLTRGSLSSQLLKFEKQEKKILSIQTRQLALGILPRHVLEAVVMLTLGCVAAVTLSTSDEKSAVLVLTVFAASTSRMLPSLIPLQSAISEFTTNLGFSKDVTRVNNFLELAEVKNESCELTEAKCLLSINVVDVNFKYESREDFALQEVNLSIEGPGWIAINGPSGSGKSTLVDVMLGVNMPTSGFVLIGTVPSRDFISSNPGFCAYVPQRITVMQASIAENIAMVENRDEIDFERVIEVLQQVHLYEAFQERLESLWEPIGELGESLSGGQLQRLGLARALYTKPQILILDESMTGLDVGVKKNLLNTIREIADTRMVITIAHDDLVTANADRVIQIKNGKLVEM